MEKHIEKYLNDWVYRYQYALSVVYPTEKNIGITEKNLTVNFARSIENQSNDKVISWYEVSIYNNQKLRFDNHLDGVVLDLDRKELFLIESKRLQGIRKIKEIENDLTRICNKDNIRKVQSRFNQNKKINFEKIYAIILMDLWTMQDATSKKYKLNKKLFEELESNTFFENFIQRTDLNKNNVNCYVKRVTEIDEYFYNIAAVVIQIKF